MLFSSVSLQLSSTLGDFLVSRDMIFPVLVVNEWYSHIRTLTSMSRHISDPVAVHPSSWNHPVNGGGRVGDIGEANALG